MKFLVFSVKDVVSGQFSDLKLFNNKDVALRWYNGLLKESQIAKDLQLYQIGIFDVEKGDFVSKFEFVQGGVVNE